MPWGCPASSPPPELEEDELGYRVTDALNEENIGSFSRRLNIVKDRCYQASLDAALKKQELKSEPC